MFNPKRLCKGTISTTLKRSYLLLCLLLGFTFSNAVGADFPFPYGIASGDADESSVVLWTRLDNAIALPHLVSWEVATDESFSTVVISGAAMQSKQAVKVLAEGLSAGWYYYRFSAAGYTSAPGRTFIADSQTEEVAFAAFSCADYQRGYFTAYEAALEQNDFQFLLFLGDYYYDNASSEGAVDVESRSHLPPYAPRTLDDFERRWKQYRSDPMLQRLHQNYGSYAIWDDHEFADDCWRDGGEGIEGAEWEALKEAAISAWYEWMPVRAREVDYDSRRLGPVNLILSETRVIGRDIVLDADDSQIQDEDRTMLGSEQEAWLESTFDENAPWNVLCSGVVMIPQIYNGLSIRPHAWDGYPAARERLKEAASEAEVSLCVLSGDMHAARVADIPGESYDSVNQTGSWGVEVTAPPVTSIVRTVPDSLVFSDENPHIRYFQEQNRGFAKIYFTALNMATQFVWVKGVLDVESTSGVPGEIYSSMVGSNAMVPETKTSFVTNPVSLVSEQTSLFNEEIESTVFPNPSSGIVTLSTSLVPGEYDLNVFSSDGRLLYGEQYAALYRGLHYIVIDLASLLPGNYLLSMEGQGFSVVEPFILSGK